MLRYFLNKIGYALLTLFGVVTVIFFLFNVLPGDPARMMLDQNENSEQLAIIKKKYGFDQPISIQYLNYLNDLSPFRFTIPILTIIPISMKRNTMLFRCLRLAIIQLL